MQRLDGSTTLPSGQRLRLRMPHSQDAPQLRRLFARLGVTADDLQLSRTLRFDPRERAVVVATILVDRSEDIVGLAAMERFAEQPELLLADETRAPGAAVILAQALRTHGEHARRSA